MSLHKAVEMARTMIDRNLGLSEIAVDATAGNGHDTLFLARKVGERGMVYAFDIQKKAIGQTTRRLEEAGMAKRVTCINDSHENMDRYVKGQPGAVMFNLGYLPGGDKYIITAPEATLEAVQKSLNLLRKGGILTMVIYTGHPGGKEEKELLLARLSMLEQKSYAVLNCTCINRLNPPELIVIEKLC